METPTERILRAFAESKYADNQAELARAAGVSRGAVNLWLNGKTKNLKMDHLFRFADAVGKSARWIATGLGPESPIKKTTPEENLLIERYRLIPVEDQPKAHAVLAALVKQDQIPTSKPRGRFFGDEQPNKKRA